MMLVKPGACIADELAIYGNVDLGLDLIRKGQGNVQGTVFGVSGSTPVPNSIASPAMKQPRLSTGLTAPSYLGFRVREIIRPRWGAGAQLEGGLTPDTGGSTNDGRLFGRQAWVGLTTPAGELRLGRQVSPMLAGYYLNTLERLGSMDMLAGAVTLNNLQTYQDNMVGYVAQLHGWTTLASYSPNAGVAARVSAARSTATASTPVATPDTGQIVGGASAGDESNTHRGQTFEAMAAYENDGLRIIGAAHYNAFRVPAGLATRTGGFVPLFFLRNYKAQMLGLRYVGWGPLKTELAVNWHDAHYDIANLPRPHIQTWGAAVRQPLGNVSLVAEGITSRFTNFSRGSDTGVMIGADYAFSKRTAIYFRAGEITDRRGTPVTGTVTPLAVAGGPVVMLVPLGAAELPIFSGAGANMGARTTLVGAGMRIAF